MLPRARRSTTVAGPGSGEFAAELAVALRAVRQAATAILAQRLRHEVLIKPDGTPVTSADLAANAAIRAAIREDFSGDAILSEEEGDDPNRQPKRYRLQRP